jgi:peptide/nickel transport system substrate-binding protein
MITSLYEGAGYQSAHVPRGFGDWSLPIDQLGPGAKYYRRDIAEAKRLLAAAGYPNGFETEVWTVNVASTSFFDNLEFLRKNLADAGINAKIVKQDYAAFIQTTQRGEMDEMGFQTAGGLPDVDSALYRYYYPGQPTNYSKVNDARLNEMLTAQRQEMNEPKRKQIVADIQKYLAEQQYLVFAPWSQSFQAFQPWIKGVGVSAVGDLMSAFAPGLAYSQWWIDKS